MSNKHKLNHISPNDIDQLNQYQLVQLLDHLLKAEAFKYGLSVLDQYVPTVKITTPDEGEDGRIIFNGNSTTRLPKNRCYFQSKASKLTAKDCANEVVDKKGNLKPAVKEIIENDGCYILFMSYDVGARANIESREKEIKEEIDNREKSISDKIQNVGVSTNNDQIKVYDSNYIADWVNEHISAIKLVDKYRGRIISDSFLPWQQFYELYFEDIFKDKFYWSDKLKELKQDLFKHLKENQSTRIIGYSGIGKTKFLSNCFNESDNDDKNVYNGAFCYIDISKSNVNDDDILNFLINHKAHSGLLVIDNCPKELHKSFSLYIKRNCKFLNLVTIDNDLDSDEEPFIHIEQSDQSDVCRNILSQIESRFSKNEFEEILNICEGYPFFANTILNHIIEKGSKTISLELEENEFKDGIIKRLIAGVEPFPNFSSSDLYNVAKGIAVFKRLPFIDDEYEEFSTVQEKSKYDEILRVVIQDVLDANISTNHFYKLARKTLKNERKLIERRGLFYSIRPEILAVNLAADWLENFPPSKISGLIDSLTASGLIEEFCERLKSLDQIERSKQLIELYWGINRPFVKAEVIKTELGSRLFRSVVEVNPVACVNGLEYTLKDFSINELKKSFGEGRRNIIWALEKLVFRNETFDKASIMMARFALAENEKYANNATNQFLQLFHVMLPGTEVNFERRIAILKELNESKKSSFKNLVLEAIGSGISFDHFSRAATADKQGTKVFKDYSPSNYDEIFKYWKSLIEIWCQIFDQEKELRIIALNKIESNIGSLAKQNRWDELDKIIKRAEKIKSNFVWVNGIQAFKRLLSYKIVQGDSINKVQELINRLEPEGNFERLIDLRVIEAPFEHKKIKKKGKDTYEDIAIRNLKDFAVEFIKQNQNPENYYSQLLVGRPRFAFLFGVEIGLKLNEEKIFKLLVSGLDFYKNLSTDNRNIEFLGGLLSIISKENQKIIINTTIDKELYKEALYLTAVIKPEKEDLKKLLSLTTDGVLPISEYLRFQYGMQLEHLGIETIIWLGNELGSINKKGYPIALSILYLHAFPDKEILNKYRDDIKRWITSINFILIDYSSTQVDDYHWAETVSLILQEENEKEFASVIMKQLVEAAENSKVHSYNTYVEKVFGMLFKYHFDSVWSILSEALIDGNSFFSLMMTLKSKNAPEIKHGILFSNLEEIKQNKVFEWCKKNRDKGAKRIAYIMPCINQKKRRDSVYYEWHPFALKMINEFGHDKDFMTEVSANLGGVSWVGNMAVYYRRLSKMIGALVDHPKRIVREWANNQIASLEKNIKRENMHHEEMYGSKK